jgi:geranylgeranyl diphosphate synthase type I
MADLPASLFARHLPEIDIGLRAACASPDDGLGEMVRYHMGWREADGTIANHPAGKRVRPVLVLLSAEAVGGEPASALPAAVAVELLHNFSLIHDDLQDRSEERRHRKTVWAVWGDAQAINAGDLQHVMAQRALLGLADTLDKRRFAAALHTFANASVKLCSGQYLDLTFETRDSVSTAEYLAMIRGKTAALLACCLRLGAIAGCDDETLWGAFEQIGDELGVAFQMWDDALDIWGDPKVTGKPRAADIVNRKKSFPVAYAMERVTGDDLARLRAIYHPANRDPAPVDEVLAILARCGAKEHAERAANERVDAAIDRLSALPLVPARAEEIVALARSFVGRSA